MVGTIVCATSLHNRNEVKYPVIMREEREVENRVNEKGSVIATIVQATVGAKNMFK